MERNEVFIMKKFFMTFSVLIISVILLIAFITKDYAGMVFPICWILLNGFIFIFIDLIFKLSEGSSNHE